MNDFDKSMKREEEKIRSKLLDIKDWKIKSSSEKRWHYDRQRKGSKGLKDTAQQSFTYDTTGELTNALSVRQHIKSSKSMVKQGTRFSRVFNKSMVAQNKASQIGEQKSTNVKKDEKVQLKELVFDKMYMNRVLWDEHVRMIFLRTGKVSQLALKNKPYIRLWMEALMNRISQKSRNLRTVLKGELDFLKHRYQIQRQLHFWQTLHALTLDQLYHKKRQMAFKKRIRYDSVYEQLDFLWKWYNKGLYSKVNKTSQTVISTVSNWSEENINSAKFKILSDLHYVRGLSLMHLEKYENAYSCFRKDSEIGTLANLKPSVDRSTDNIARIQAIKGNYKQARKLWTKRVPDITDMKEKAWFYYNIAQCMALEDNHEKAIETVNKCIASAEKCKSFCWELNGNLLLANCSALLGMSKEMNVRSHTLTSLKALNRAYQCAVYLANVSVIKKIMDIVVHIYNSFKDVDLSMLEDVWSMNLMEFARKAALMESEKAPERKNMNLNNPVLILPNHTPKKIKTEHPKFDKEIKQIKPNLPIGLPQISNFNNYPKNVKKSRTSKENNKITVRVYNDELDAQSPLLSEDLNIDVGNYSNYSIKSPITAVEVITSDEVVDHVSNDEWVTDSEEDGD